MFSCFSLDNKALYSHSTIVVDSSTITGNLSPIYRMGFFTSNPEFDYAIKKTFDENPKIGTIECYLIHPTITPSANLADLVKKLKEWDELVLAIKRKGGNVVIEITGMPLWLSSNLSKAPLDQNNPEPRAYHSPPKDYTQWSNMVQAIVNHFNNELGINARYKIWGEPDWAFWLGTEEEYFTLYKYSVLGAKRADPQAKIGGPSVGHWESVKKQPLKKPGTDPMLYNFIKFCSNTPLPELGLKKLPIDFLVFHAFNVDPSSTYSYSLPVTKIRKWLKQCSYDENTEILIGEWNTWGTDRVVNHIFSSRTHDTSFTSSYIIATLISMDKAGINSSSFAYLKDILEGPEFSGDFGLFTKKNIIKPSYNAMNLLGMIGNKKLGLHVDDPFIAAVASKDDTKISLLFSNFIPTGKMLREDLRQELFNRGYTLHTLNSYGITKELAAKILKNEKSLQDLDIPKDIKTDLDNIVQKYRNRLHEAEKRIQSNIPVKIIFKDLPAGEDLLYERYLIDHKNSNSFNKRNEVEQAVNRALKFSAQAGIDYLKERKFSSKEIESIINAFKGGRAETLAHTLSHDKMEDLKRAINIKNNVFIKEIEKINESSDIRLTKIEEKHIKGIVDYSELLNVEPYSVTLIQLNEN